MLSQTTFEMELAAFHVAGGYPRHREDARDRWAAAFLTYISDLSCTDPLLSPQASATFALCEAAFRAPLTLLQKMSAAEAATEFAAAWFAGVSAVLLMGNAPVTYSSAPASSILHTPGGLPPKQGQLATSLTALFSQPAMQRSVRISEIATAFHVASSAMAAQATLPGPAIQALVYG